MSVECICADGLSIPPLNIFTGENSVRQCIPSTFDNDSQWIFSNTSKGWIRVQHGLEWVQKCFEPSTRDKANGQFRLLICDGHDSHCSPQFLSHCAEHRILVLALVPHSSHLTQPLNVTVFGPLKRIVSGIINPMFQLGITRIQKSEWIEAYSKAHMKAFPSKQSKRDFRAGVSILPTPTKFSIEFIQFSLLRTSYHCSLLRCHQHCIHRFPHQLRTTLLSQAKSSQVLHWIFRFFKSLIPHGQPNGTISNLPPASIFAV